VGKKLTQAILQEREKAPFKSLAEIGERIKGLDAKNALVKRILMEIEGKDAYFLFVRPWRKTEE
jgi:predicted nucleic acid-binding OB-fold protein